MTQQYSFTLPFIQLRGALTREITRGSYPRPCDLLSPVIIIHP